jgi:hypothetical protein
MGFSNDEFDARIAEDGRLARENSDKFNNFLHCEHVDYCEGMAARVAASAVRDQKVCYRNPGRKDCECWIGFEKKPCDLRIAG